MTALPFETPSSRPGGRLPAGPVAQNASAFGVRRFPYPYEAALAICSDLDETPNRDIYYETAKFLNTTQMTSMGRGVGLEVGNTIYFDMPARAVLVSGTPTMPAERWCGTSSARATSIASIRTGTLRPIEGMRNGPSMH